MVDQTTGRKGDSYRMENDWFTCPDCSSSDLLFYHEYLLIKHYKRVLACQCDSPAEEGVAAERSVHQEIIYEERGPLHEDHRWAYEDGEEMELVDEAEDDFQVYCRECYSHGQLHPEGWEMCEVTTEISDEASDHDFYVHCAGCMREIEFGWSHPERGGRVWPSECGDFNPWLCWPEPRYREKWKEKNWLRPIGRKRRPK